MALLFFVIPTWDYLFYRSGPKDPRRRLSSDHRVCQGAPSSVTSFVVHQTKGGWIAENILGIYVIYVYRRYIVKINEIQYIYIQFFSEYHDPGCTRLYFVENCLHQFVGCLLP